MIIAKTVSQVRRAREITPEKSWGFVPTMGMLHDGHLSLVRRAKSENDLVAASIFINPIQFNDPKDYEKYPQDLQKDLDLLKKANVDLVFTPTSDLMYPPGFSSNLSLQGLSQVLEGAARPGHFDGVTTVVAKLFNIVQPTRAYFGQKDAQQLLVIEKMVLDMDYNLTVVACPTCREVDGLAMSSRNIRLTPKQRKEATVLFQSLQKAEALIKQGVRDAAVILQAMRAVIQTAEEARIDYLAINRASTLETVGSISGRCLISLAVFFGEVRLIDNTIVSVA